MVIKRKQPSLKTIFLEYLFAMVLALFLAVAVPYAFFTVGTTTGLYTYANSSEIQANYMKPKIAAAKKFDSSLVPASCKYVFLSRNFTVMKSNMDKIDLKNAVAYARGEYIPNSPDNCYLLITRDDGYCILHYYIHSQYTIAWMNRFLPLPDKLLEFFFALNTLLSCFVIAALFAKRLRKQLKPLMDATQKIRNKDLDFEIQPSGIKEFNHILLSISEMKSELKDSLEHQWRMEQAKKEQTSALAHDIKTPLTIIRGNAELLNASNQTAEQHEYTNYILKNAGRMEQYLRILIDLTQAEIGYPVQLKKISTDEFIKEIMDQASGLAVAKKLEVEFSMKELPHVFTADPGLLQRGIMNVVSNAADYSPEGGKIRIIAETVQSCIRFCIEDEGKGFSPVDLKKAAYQFYTGDSSRALKTHYGIGLYITELIVRLHKGTLRIANSPTTGGGQVTIEIPVSI